MSIKTRESGKASRPDAELVEVASSLAPKFEFEKSLKIVVDAKYYTSQLSQETIEKTIDDTYLRSDDNYEAFALLVCSEETGLDEYNFGIFKGLWNFD